MIYLDSGATSFYKPTTVYRAVKCAMDNCANPGRGGYTAAMTAAKTVLNCREQAAELFSCRPEQVVMTSNCTHGLNIAINTLVKPGARVVISGFEHNAVTRPLHHRQAKITVAGRRLFDWENTLETFESALKRGADVAIFTHVSNVFGYILPIEEMAKLCIKYNVPFIVDAAQSAGIADISMEKLGAAFIAMPGHKGLLGPQGTGLLLCNTEPAPLLFGGTGSVSVSQEMPEDLPDRLEAGTLNVPGIAGLGAGIRYIRKQDCKAILTKETAQVKHCAEGLRDLGMQVFTGDCQAGTLSFLPHEDPEDFAQKLAKKGIAVRAGLHCAPTAHQSAGTLQTGTVRVSFGHDATSWQTDRFLRAAQACFREKYLQ